MNERQRIRWVSLCVSSLSDITRLPRRPRICGGRRRPHHTAGTSRTTRRPPAHRSRVPWRSSKARVRERRRWRERGRQRGRERGHGSGRVCTAVDSRMQRTSVHWKTVSRLVKEFATRVLTCTDTWTSIEGEKFGVTSMHNGRVPTSNQRTIVLVSDRSSRDRISKSVCPIKIRSFSVFITRRNRSNWPRSSGRPKKNDVPGERAPRSTTRRQ